MAESRTEICNLAISHLGIADEIADVSEDGDNSEAANACRRFYDIARRATLRDFDWVFARKPVALTEIEDDDDEIDLPEEWGYVYRYPTDALCIRRISSGARNDSRQSRIEFTEQYNDTYGILIMTDQEDAVAIYTVDHDNPVYYPPDFELAFSLRLAYYIAPRLAGKESRKLKAELWQLYSMEIGRAMANIANEEQAPEPVQSEFVRARE